MSVTRKLVFLVWIVASLVPAIARAQPSGAPKRVLVLYWYDKDFPANVRFDRAFQAVLQTVPAGNVEYYPEYLEDNRFPGQHQSELLRNYLHEKYADLPIDVIVTNGYVPLGFLLKYRNDLFPNTPAVFLLLTRPTPEQLAAPPGLTGIIIINTYVPTLEMALSLHPNTEQVFIVSGTLEHDKRYETMARQELRAFESRVRINYVTDLSPSELSAKMKSVPERSIVLYVWQQSQNEQGRVVEAADVLSLIVNSTSVPIYGMIDKSVGNGIVGGYVYTIETSATRAAEMALKIANGAKPQDIPVESAPSIPMFDWRQLRRWSISEEALPPGSIVRFKEATLWDQYKWRIIGVIAVILVEAALIALLLFERRQRWRATRYLSESEERYRGVVETQTELICRFLPDTTLTFVNDAYCRYFGKSRDELIGLKFIEMIPTDHQAAARRHIQSLIENPRTDTHEHEVVRPDGTIGWQQWINHVISGGDSIELQGIGRDITERHLAVQAIQESEERFAKAFRSNPQPMSLTTLDEGKYVDVNESFLRMSGYTRGEVVGHTSAELRIFEFPEDRQRLLVQPLIKAGVLRNIEIRFRVKDGGLRTLLSSAELIELSGQKCILVASSDITERKESEHRLAELTGRLLKTQDEERRHIARELHDVTAQNIGLIMLNLAQVQSGAPTIDQKNQQRLTESLALGEQALKEIRTLSYVLHPPLLDQAGLVTALRWYVKGFSERSGVRVDFNESGNNGQRMPPDVEYALFRVVQECLTNIRRHTNSETAEIDLQRTARTILLTVHDHGTAHVQMPSGGDGIESLGVGIPGMRHRLKQLGGELSVDANVNGTMVTAMVPVRWVIHDSSTVGG